MQKIFIIKCCLQEHVTLTHKATIESYAFACDQCPKRFKGSQNLKRHLEVHGSEKIFKCAECNAGYSRKETLEVHLFRQHGFDAKIKCHLCKNAFPNMSKLRKHQEKYKAECGEKFRTRTIDKNVEYSCNFCYRVYKDKTHYQSHIHMHNNNR